MRSKQGIFLLFYEAHFYCLMILRYISFIPHFQQSIMPTTAPTAAWSNKQDRYIIEDDFESEFSVSSKPSETLFSLSSHDNVIYLNTFSKTISPSMRVGYMILPRHLVKTFANKLGFYSCTVPTFEQFVLAELIDNGDFERHINRVRRNKRKELSDKPQK